jgi:hypothetical protein
MPLPPPHLHQIAVPLARQLQVTFRRPPRLLLEAVQDVHRLSETRYVQDPMLAGCVKPNFLDPWTDVRHRLPVIGRQPLLHSSQLEAGATARFLREGLDVLDRRSEPGDRLCHAFGSIQVLIYPVKEFGTPATERSDTAAAVRGGEAEVLAARATEEAWKDAQRARRAAGRGGRGTQTVSADAEGAGERARDTRTGAPELAASQAADLAAAFGRLVHALLALPEPLTGESLQQAAQAHRLAYGLSETEAAEAAGLAERVQALPAVAAARTAEAVHRELPGSGAFQRFWSWLSSFPSLAGFMPSLRVI